MSTAIPDGAMDTKKHMLRHFLATLAYRTQKALRDAPENFADFRVKPKVRTPHELIWHMTGVLQYAVSLFADVETWPDQMPTFREEVDRFHSTLEELGRHLDAGTPLRDTTPERILQGPFSDAMTHAGQLIMLRRLCGSPVLGEGFMLAAIDPYNLGPNQPDPVSPDEHMREP